MSKNSKQKWLKTRDHNMVSIIKGATKAGVHTDRKKEASRTASRSKVKVPESMCLQCGFSFRDGTGKTEDENLAMECGYCSVSCMDYCSEN